MHSMRTINSVHMHTKNVMVGDVTIRMIMQAWCLIVPIFLYTCFSVHPFLFSPVNFTLNWECGSLSTVQAEYVNTKFSVTAASLNPW